MVTNGVGRRPSTKAAYRHRKNQRPKTPSSKTPTLQTLDGSTTDFSFGHTVAGVGDVDGDGFDDILVGSFNGGTNASGEVHLYRGSANGVIPKPWRTFRCPVPKAEFGHQVEGLGDVNGDGYADFVVGATYYTDKGKTAQTGGAFVYLGGPNGPRLAPGWPISGEVAKSKTGFTVAAAGDVNGDGFDDILVGAWGSSRLDGTADPVIGRVLLFLGGPDGPSTNACWSPSGEKYGAEFGYSVHGAGDVNGDGYADIVIGSHGYENAYANCGRVYVYYGGPNGPSTKPNWTLTGSQADQVTGNSVFTAGDVNGDGFDDLIVGANGTSHPELFEGIVMVFYGSAKGLPNRISWSFEPHERSMFLGHSVATAGDINHDGYDDIVISAADGRQYLPGEGVAFVFHGSPRGLSRSPNWTFRGTQTSSGYGATVRSAGDVNGDGFDDIIVGHPRFSGEVPRQGRAWIHFGSPDGLRETSDWPRGLRPGLEAYAGWAALGGMALSVGALALVKYRHQLRERSLAEAARMREHVQQEERRRIAQDLHDQLGADLTEIAVASATLRHHDPVHAARLTRIEVKAAQLVENLAELVWVTKPSNDHLDAMASYVADVASEMLGSAGMVCSLDIPADLPNRPLGYELRHDLVLALKEALHNCVKHSGGTQASVAFRLQNNYLKIVVTDNGSWREPRAGAAPGNGLVHLKLRLQRHGGTALVESSDAGTTVSLTMPISI